MESVEDEGNAGSVIREVRMKLTQAVFVFDCHSSSLFLLDYVVKGYKCKRCGKACVYLGYKMWKKNGLIHRIKEMTHSYPFLDTGNTQVKHRKYTWFSTSKTYS